MAMAMRCLTGRRIRMRMHTRVLCLIYIMCLQFVACELRGDTDSEEERDVGEDKKRRWREPLKFQEWSQVIATEWSKRISSWPDKRPSSQRSHEAQNGDKRIHTVATEDVWAVESLGGIGKQQAALDAVEMEHEEARKDLQKWLTPVDMWHFMVGYTNLRALKVAERITPGAQVLHYPSTNGLQFFLTFISATSAELLKNNSLFHVVEPLLPNLKIEDLTLGKMTRDFENGEKSDNYSQEPLALKATLATGILIEAKLLAEDWEVVLQQISQNPQLSNTQSKTKRYTDGEGHMGIHQDEFLKKKRGGDYKEECSDLSFQDMENKRPEKDTPKCSKKISQLQEDATSVVKCAAEAETAIVCSPIPKTALQVVAQFMAEHAVVQLVELNPRYQLFNKWAKYVTQSVSGKHLSVFNQGLLGQGEVIGCADTGIDMDHCFFWDRNRPVPYNEVDLQARKVVQYVMYWGDKTDFLEGHGTHVAGSIAGDTEEGANVFAGMAPAAKLAFFDLGSNTSDLKAPVDLGKGIFSHGLLAGAQIFSNSWGVATGVIRQGYSSNAHDVDSFSYLNENVLIIFAAGNQGANGKETVASPASSKNCLAVGASFNAAESFTPEKAKFNKEENVMRPSTVAPFSSVGPTIDGRIKPDVLAPGMMVWSSVPNFGYPPEQNCLVQAKQGTSSSAPVVAGLAALARQYFREGYYPSGKKSLQDSFNPSGALLKAVLIHSVVQEQRFLNSSGTDDLRMAPDNVQVGFHVSKMMAGYGRVVLEKVLVFAKPDSKKQPSRLYVLSGRQDGAVIKHTSVHILTFSVLSPKEPLRVTMVWMDPPAAPSCLHPMINDLNLKAQDPDNNTIYPNALDGVDSINNVEVIHVAKPKVGLWRVAVEATKVVTDKQPYAMVITGHFSALSQSWGHQTLRTQGATSSAMAAHIGIAHWQHWLTSPRALLGMLCTMMIRSLAILIA